MGAGGAPTQDLFETRGNDRKKQLEQKSQVGMARKVTRGVDPASRPKWLTQVLWRQVAGGKHVEGKDTTGAQMARSGKTRRSFRKC